jgi:uncharacterized membrane protein required for colicin V production
MIGGVSWSDVAIFAVLALATIRGFNRGFVGELAGVVALLAGLIVPWYYNGVLDDWIHGVTGLPTPMAHLIGMGVAGLAAYLAVLIVAGFLGRVKKLPVLGFGNAALGGVVGFAKGAVLVWLILFVSLFFPLNAAIRSSLHDSMLAPYFVAYDPTIDHAILSTIPAFALPLLKPLFARHHV